MNAHLTACLSGLLLACGGGVPEADAIPDVGDAVVSDFGSDTFTDSSADTKVDAINDTGLPTAFLIQVIESRPAAGEQWALVAVSNPPAEEMVQTDAARVGDCIFSKPAETGACEEFCAWPGYCGADNLCHEGLPRRWAGEITFTGLLDQCKVSIIDYGTYSYYQGDCQSDQPHDLFEAGSVVTAIAAGGDDIPGFELGVPGVGTIEKALPCESFSLQAGSSLTVNWTPAGQPGDRILFHLRSANHGGQFGHIDCETDDTGTLTVDSSLIELHLDEFNPAPSWVLARVHSSSALTDGTVAELEIRSQISCMYSLK